MIDLSKLPDRQCPTCASLGVTSFAVEGTFFECPEGHPWWRANPGPQTRFVNCNAHEILYGGAAGGGKSAALVMLPLRWVDNRAFRALILRRETGELGDLIDLTKRWYPIARPGVHGANQGGSYLWTFPEGAKVLISHCKDPGDWRKYLGQQYQWIGFDELTTFLWDQYQNIKSRIRGAHAGLPRHVRSTSNPGGEGHEWVFGRWGPWLNPEFEAQGLKPRFFVDHQGRTTDTRVPPLASGQIAWVEKIGDVERFSIVRPADFDPRRHTTRTFIGAKLSDNRVLTANDPGYARNLQDLDPVRRMQLELGDWLVKPAKGMYFKRAWWKPVKAIPANIKLWCRYWDRAASEDVNADWTVGLRMGRIDDLYFIDDIVRLQGSPGTIEQTIYNTAVADGVQVHQVLELDPGQAGLTEAYQYAKLLSGFRCHFPRPTGDKVTRAGTCSSQVQAGNVHVLQGKPWLSQFLGETEAFPEDTHDDVVDALSGSYNYLFRLGGGSSRARTAGVTPQAPPLDSMPLG